MKSLIERLREPWRMPEKKPPVMDEAADALEAQQARIAELREALTYHQEQTRPIQRTMDALAKTDDLSALEAVKRQARREALMEAAKMCEQHGHTLGAILAAEIKKEIEK